MRTTNLENYIQKFQRRYERRVNQKNPEYSPPTVWNCNYSRRLKFVTYDFTFKLNLPEYLLLYLKSIIIFGLN